jgi:hypothetical protein
MFGLGPATKIYLAVEAVDMRKGFEACEVVGDRRLYQVPCPLPAMLPLFSDAETPEFESCLPPQTGLEPTTPRLTARILGRQVLTFLKLANISSGIALDRSVQTWSWIRWRPRTR